MTTKSSALIKDWFGVQFDELHPLLQQLHVHGGVLDGEVQIQMGRGVAGMIGQRLAHKLGVPVDTPRSRLRVAISHTDEALIWERRFTDAKGVAHDMVSKFEPVGTWPHGYWLEQTGALHFKLTVDVKDGGWHWRPLAAALHGVPLPVSMLPQSDAWKRIEGGAYRFHVGFAMPLLGELLSYQGLLAASSQADNPRP